MKKETTITYLDTQLTLVGNFEAEEKQYMYESDLGGYRGCPARFEITKVLTESGDNIIGIFYPEQLSDLEDLALINLEE